MIVFPLNERSMKVMKFGGDFIAIRSAGAYGQSMAYQYNCRPLAPAYFSE